MKKTNIPYQLEVEDLEEVMGMVYKEWLSLGLVFCWAPEDNVHSPDEKVHKKDIQSMLDLYKELMKKL